MNKINKTDIVNIVADKAYLSKNDAINAVDIVFETIEKCLLDNNEVNILNFGSFVPSIKKATIGTNPKTHEKIEIKEKRIISFKLSKTFQKNLND